jgi:hypothetical protein
MIGGTLVLPLVVSNHRIQEVRVQYFLLPFISSSIACYCLLDGVLEVSLTFSNTYWLSHFSIVLPCRQCVLRRCCRRWTGDVLSFHACATKHLELAMHDRRNAGIAAGGIESSDSGSKGAMFLTSFHFKCARMLLFAGWSFGGSIDVF